MDMFPDEILLAIFDLCAHEDPFTKSEIQAWQSLVHVCRRWRGIVFGSPRRLNLRLYCTTMTPVKDMLDVWPALPLLIRDDDNIVTEGVDSIVAALERSDRVCQIILWHAPRWNFEKVLAATQEPFPELTNLNLRSYDVELVFPDSFLGASTPCLQSITLDRISFPGLPKLLLSAPHLVKICFTNIPRSGYISPEEVLVALSTLTSLESLWLEFQSPQSCPDRPGASRHPPPPIRSVLPVLTSFRFKGVCEYLEDLVAHIDAPQLGSLHITFFDQIVIGTSQFIQFISRTPRLKELEKAYIAFGGDTAWLTLSSQTFGHGDLNVTVSCEQLDRQISSLIQVWTSSLPPFSMLEDLYVYKTPYWQLLWQHNIENMLWLELLRPFTGVKNLYLSEEFAPHVASALQELVRGRTTEVLPVLRNIFLEGLQPSAPVQECIGQFVATRQVAGHPIVISFWDRG